VNPDDRLELVIILPDKVTKEILSFKIGYTLRLSAICILRHLWIPK